MKCKRWETDAPTTRLPQQATVTEQQEQQEQQEQEERRSDKEYINVQHDDVKTQASNISGGN